MLHSGQIGVSASFNLNMCLLSLACPVRIWVMILRSSRFSFNRFLILLSYGSSILVFVVVPCLYFIYSSVCCVLPHFSICSNAVFSGMYGFSVVSRLLMIVGVFAILGAVSSFLCFNLIFAFFATLSIDFFFEI